MIGKRLRKITRQLLSIFYIFKKKKRVQLISQKLIRIVKTNNSINNSKRRKRKLTLSCIKIIYLHD